MRPSKTRTSIAATVLATVLSCCLASQAGAEPLKIGLVLGQRPSNHEREAAALNAATQAFLLSRRFTVVERAALDSIFQEKGLKGFIGDNEGAAMTDTEGLDWIGILTYTTETVRDPDGGRHETYVLSLRMIEVKTAQVLYTIDSREEESKQSGMIRKLGHRMLGRHAGAEVQQVVGDMESLSAEDSFDAAGKRLLNKILETFPPEGYVIDVVDARRVVVDIGADQGLREGDFLEVYSIGPPIIHPVTGVELPGREIYEGKLKVLSVDSVLSTCKVKSSDGGVDVGARVRFEPKEGLIDRAINKLPFGG